MADEPIRVETRLDYYTDELIATHRVRGVDNQSGEGFYQDVVAVTTLSAALANGDVADPAWFFLHNIGLLPIEWGTTSGTSDALLLDSVSGDRLLLQSDQPDVLLLSASSGAMPFELPAGSSSEGKLKPGQTLYVMSPAGGSILDYTLVER